jgi:hypothetical protein
MSAETDPMTDGHAAAIIVGGHVAQVIQLLQEVEPERQRLQVSPGGVPVEMRADLFDLLLDLVQTLGAFRDAAHELVLSAATDGPVVTSDGRRGWKRAEHRSGGFGGNPYLVPLTPGELP